MLGIKQQLWLPHPPREARVHRVMPQHQGPACNLGITQEQSGDKAILTRLPIYTEVTVLSEKLCYCPPPTGIGTSCNTCKRGLENSAFQRLLGPKSRPGRAHVRPPARHSWWLAQAGAQETGREFQAPLAKQHAHQHNAQGLLERIQTLF